MNWVVKAERLKTGQSARIDCPKCGVGTGTHAAVIYNKIHQLEVYCHACEFSQKRDNKIGLREYAELIKLNRLSTQPMKVELPKDFTGEIPLEGRIWLYKAGITESVWREFGIGYSNSQKRVVLPLYNAEGELKWLQARATLKGMKPKYRQPPAPKDFLCVRESGDYSRIVVVEDILSWIRVSEVQNCMSLLGTHLKDGQVIHLLKYKEVVTWLDPDKGGDKGRRECRKKLLGLTRVHDVVTEKDPKYYSRQEIKENLERLNE